MEPRQTKSIILSFIFPGLGHVANGDRRGGFAMMAASLGILFLLFWDPSWLASIFAVIAYLSLVFHAAKDLRHGTRNTESVEYIMGLSAVVGPFVLPLLWQNRRLGPKTKIFLTVLIIVITVFLVLAMIYLDPLIEHALEPYKQLLSPKIP